MPKPLAEWLRPEIIRVAIPLRDVPRYLPRLRRGKRVHVATVYRWAGRGVRGERLATFRVGGTLCTTPDLLAAFLARLTEPSGDAPAHNQSRPRTSREVERELDRLGL
jgi:hypothetical protein